MGNNVGTREKVVGQLILLKGLAAGLEATFEIRKEAENKEVAVLIGTVLDDIQNAVADWEL